MLRREFRPRVQIKTRVDGSEMLGVRRCCFGGREQQGRIDQFYNTFGVIYMNAADIMDNDDCNVDADRLYA